MKTAPLIPAFFVAAVLCIWEAAVRFFDVPEYLLPAPSVIAGTIDRGLFFQLAAMAALEFDRRFVRCDAFAVASNAVVAGAAGRFRFRDLCLQGQRLRVERFNQCLALRVLLARRGQLGLELGQLFGQMSPIDLGHLRQGTGMGKVPPAFHASPRSQGVVTGPQTIGGASGSQWSTFQTEPAARSRRTARKTR